MKKNLTNQKSGNRLIMVLFTLVLMFAGMRSYALLIPVGSTWNGVTSTDWNIATNWTPNGVPSSAANVDIPSAPGNQPIIGSAGGACKNLTIESGATLTITGSNTLTVSGNWSNSGTFTANSSTVTFGGAANQSISASTIFYNLNLSSNHTVAFGAVITISSNLSVSSGTILDLSTFTSSANSLTLGGICTVSGSWGSTSSSATNTNNTYFAAHTGILNVAAPVSTPGSITGSTSICAGSTQTYTIAAVAGATSYTWTLPGDWSGTSTTTTITVTVGTVSGNVSVTANNDCGTSSASQSSITVNPLPNAGTLSGNTPFCATSGQNFITSGTPSGAWASSNLAVFTISAASSNSENVWGQRPGGVANLIYTVTTTNCGSATATISITIKDLSDTGTISGPTSVCAGSNANLYDNSVDTADVFYSHIWQSSNTNIATINSSGVVHGVMAGSVNISYHVTGCGGFFTHRPYTFTVNASPLQPGSITGNTTVCSGSTQTYTIATVSGATGYTWILPGDWSGTSTTTSITTTVGTNAGTVSVASTTGCGTSSASSTSTITPTTAVPSTPGSITGSTSVCPGSTKTYTIAAVTGATSYTWTIPGGWSGTSTTTSITTTAGTNGGTVSVTATNVCGTSSASTTGSISMYSAPVFTSCVPNQTANTLSNSCASNVTYSTSEVVTGNPAPTIAYAFNGATTASGSGDGSGSSFNQGTTSVFLTAVNTCGNTNCSFNVVVNDVTPPTITCPGNLTVTANNSGCTANNVTLTTPTVSDNCNYGNAVNFDGSNDFMVAGYSGASLTQVTVEFWFKKGNTTGSGIFQWADGITSTNPWILIKDQGTSLQLYVNGSYRITSTTLTTGTWYHCAATYNGTTWTMYLNGVSAGTYTGAIGSYGSNNIWFGNGYPAYWNGSISEARIWNVARTGAQISANMNYPISAQNNLTVLYHFNQGTPNGNNSGLIGVNDASGNNENAGLNNLALTGTTSNWVTGPFPIVVNNAPSTYPLGNTIVTWTITDASANTATCSQTVTVTNPVSAGITGTTTGCSSVTLTATGGGTYAWSGGGSTAAAVNNFTNSGSYSVTVSNANSCSSSSSANVTVNNTPATPGSITGSTSVCSGSEQTYTIAAVSGATSYTWSLPGDWTGTSTNTSITITVGSDAGTVSVTATNDCGTSSASSTGSITVNTPPNPTITGGPTFCGSGTLSTGTYSSYQWGDNSTNETLTVTSTNTYYVTVTDGNGCTGASTKDITVNELPTVSASSNSPVCVGSDLNLHDASTGNSFSWTGPNNFTSSDENPIVTDVTTGATGTYTLIVTDNSTHCTNTTTTDVVVNSLPNVSASSNSPVCSGSELDLYETTSANSFSWTGPDNFTSDDENPIVTDVNTGATGTYTLAVTDNTSHCTNTTTTNVTVDQSPNVSAGNDTSICLGNSITLVASGGTTYVWNNNINNTNTIPLDNVSSATLALGLRKLNSSYNGNALQLIRSSDNATRDFGFAGNDLDVGSIQTWLNGASGYCSILYDQSGNGGNVIQGSQNQQPLFVINGLNGNPSLHFTTSNWMFNEINYPTPYTVIYGSRETGPNYGRVLSSINTNWLLGYWSGSKGQAYFNGWVSNSGGDPSDNSFYVYTGESDGSISSLFENGTLLYNNSGGVSGFYGIELNGIGNGGETSNCDFSDVMVFGSVLSDNDRASVENSISGYQNSTDLTVSPNTTTTYTVVGNSDGCSSTGSVTVTVNAPSVLTCPSDITQEVFGNDCSAIMTYSPATATEDATIIYSQNSGTTFYTGNTTVVVTATNSCGPTTCSFTVTVHESVPPTITCASDITVNNDYGNCNANVMVASPSATDNCSLFSVLNNYTNTSNANGNYPIGTTGIVWTATDVSGNTATCSQKVTVVQNSPVINCPSDVTVNSDNGLCTASGVNFSASNVCGSSVFTYNPSANSTFNFGTVTVTATATYYNSSTATCSFTLMVIDNQPPVIAGCSSNITVNNDNGNCSAIVTYTNPTASDNCSPALYNQTFSYTGSPTSYTVPSNITTITVGAWGAGGGGGGHDGDAGGRGGGGAYSSNVLSVNPGDVLTFYVGGGGTYGSGCNSGSGHGNGGFGYGTGANGGDAGSNGCSGGGGGGGGATAILNGNTILVLASGGGGGGGGGNDGPSGSGGGGNTSGENANNTYGGSSGTSGTINGTQGTNRGNGDGGAGGGGGGGLSGGSGGGAPNCDCSGGGGGGGSSFGTSINGNGIVPGNEGTLSGFCSDCAIGGNGQNYGGNPQTSGGNGFLVISFYAIYPPLTQTGGLSSGSAYPVGTTTNTFSSVDAVGNTSTCSFTVTVNDVQPPVIACPANITANYNNGNCNPVITFSVAQSDNCELTQTLQTFNYTGSIQTYTVPVGITALIINAIGAEGGPSYYGGYSGLGASISGKVSVSSGQVLNILVGGQGNIGNDGGGGGGTFVTDVNNNPIVIAGGGGGAYFSSYSFDMANADASITTSGKNGINANNNLIAGIGGINGNGGGADNNLGYYVGAGGGGFLSNGANGFGNAIGGSSFLNGGNGGYGCSSGNGGFGGGGGSDWCYYTGAGGGGGYSGGGGGSYYGVGGGGGSYNSGTNQNNIAGVGSGDGSVTIYYDAPPGVISGISSGSVFPLGTTVNTLIATDVSGNTATCSFSVTVMGLTQPPPIIGNTSVCGNNPQVYSIAPVSGATSYTWTTPAGWTGSSTANSILTTVGNTGGDVTVTVNNNCGSSPAQTISVSVTNIPPQPAAIFGNSSICAANHIQTYTIAPVGTATSYVWTLPNGWLGTSNTTSITATANSTSGNVTAKAINFCGYSPAAVLSVNVTTIPVEPGAITGSTSVCQNSVYTFTCPSVGNATSYIWTLPNSWSGSSTTTSITCTAGPSTGNVTVKASNFCGNSPARSLSISHVSYQPATPGPINGNTTACSGTGYTYTIASVQYATSYSWTLPSGWSGTSTTTSIHVTPGSSGGNILVHGADSCGYGSASTLAVFVPGTIVTPGSISGNSAPCIGSHQTYSIAQVQNAASYIWTIPSSWTGTSTTTSIATTVGTGTGTITVKSHNYCYTSSAQTLPVNTVHTNTAVTISGNPQNFNYCTYYPANQTSEVLTASGGFSSYSWSPGGGNTQTATVSSINTFTVTATNSFGCTSSASKAVTNNCALPTNLATNTLTSRTAKVTWTESQCGYNYVIQIRPHGGNNWTSYTISANYNYTFSGLIPNTTYDWQLQANCNTSGSINSGMTAIHNFTTPSTRVAEEDNNSTPFNVYPNPADALVTIAFSTMEEGTYNIKLIDMLGQVVKSEIGNASLGENTYIMNLDGIAKGIYMVILQKGDNISKAKLVVE